MKYAFIPETGLINGWLTDEQAIGRTDWTEIPPISVPPGKTNRWTGTEWEVVDIPADPWEIWQAKLDGTITDPVSGVRLKADEHSKSRFTEGLVLLGAGFTAWVGEFGGEAPADEPQARDLDEIRAKAVLGGARVRGKPALCPDRAQNALA